MDYVWKDLEKIGNTSSLITKCFNSLVERYINFWQDRINGDNDDNRSVVGLIVLQ